MSKAERVEVVENDGLPLSFTVEAIDVDGDGAVDLTVFSGLNAKERAAEYAAWKYQDAYSTKAT